VDTRATARSLSGGRTAVGAACFAAPELTTRLWIGDDAGRTGARLLAPALGAREVVLAGNGRPWPRHWSVSGGGRAVASDRQGERR
jgi:hypothetical protein